MCVVVGVVFVGGVVPGWSPSRRAPSPNKGGGSVLSVPPIMQVSLPLSPSSSSAANTDASNSEQQQQQGNPWDAVIGFFGIGKKENAQPPSPRISFSSPRPSLMSPNKSGAFGFQAAEKVAPRPASPPAEKIAAPPLTATPTPASAAPADKVKRPSVPPPTTPSGAPTPCKRPSVPPPPPKTPSVPPPPPKTPSVPPPPPKTPSVPPPPPSAPAAAPPPPLAPPAIAAPPPPPPPAAGNPPPPPPPPLPPMMAPPPVAPPPPPPPPVPSLALGGGAPATPSCATPALPARSSNLRGIYWKKVAPTAVEGSVWEGVAALLSSGGGNRDIASAAGVFDAEELESAFATTKAATNGANGAAASAATPRGTRTAYVELLDHKRATNAGITLARLGIPHGGALTAAILSMDESRLPLAKVQSLLQVAPTSEEAEMIRGYDGDVALLGSTERYFAELIQIPRLAPRLNAWVVKQRFAAQAADLRERHERLRAAFGVLMSDASLHTALGLLLALGNALNAGTARANAHGFRIDSTLSSNAKVLTFLARHARRAAPELAGQVQAALAGVSPACRLDATELANEVNSLAADLAAVATALKAHEPSPPPTQPAEAGGDAADVVADRFADAMGAFLTGAQASLSELQEGAASLRDDAVRLCGFYCEKDDTSVEGAHSLLTRLHSFFAALVAAHEQVVKEDSATEAKALRSATKATAAAAAATAAAARQGGVDGGDFEASDSSLRAILEDGDGAAGDANEGASVAASRTLTRRATTSLTTPAKQAKHSADELQALFMRRASGLSLNSKTPKAESAAPVGLASPSKRPRRAW